MIGVSEVITLAVAMLGSLFMAWTIGAGSSGSTPFAPAVGANAMSIMRAGFTVGILGFIGAVLQGANVSETIGSGLIEGVTAPPLAVTIGLLTAAMLVAIGIFTGYPIATAFTVTGAMTGVGIGLGGAPIWSTYQTIISLWVLIPFVGSTIAFITGKILDGDRISTDIVIAVLITLTAMVVANMEFTILGPPEKAKSPATIFSGYLVAFGISELIARLSMSLFIGAGTGILCRRRYVHAPEQTEKMFLTALGGLVAFSAGATQVGLAVGPLLPIIDGFSVPTIAILTFGGVGLLIGSWTGAPRMIKTLSQDYSALGPKRSIAALVPSFLIAQTAVFLGIPVSFNEIIVTSIVGSGYSSRQSPVSLTKMRNTALAWIGSLVLSGLCSYIIIATLQTT